LRKILVNDYDLVIMDINMPKMNGIETVKAIRENDPDTYILLISGEANQMRYKRPSQTARISSCPNRSTSTLFSRH